MSFIFSTHLYNTRGIENGTGKIVTSGGPLITRDQILHPIRSAEDQCLNQEFMARSGWLIGVTAAPLPFSLLTSSYEPGLSGLHWAVRLSGCGSA